MTPRPDRQISPIWASAEQLLRRQGPPPEGAVQPAGSTLPPKLATTAPQDAEPADPSTATTEAVDAAIRAADPVAERLPRGLPSAMGG